jgi:hypothetical protein
MAWSLTGLMGNFKALGTRRPIGVPNTVGRHPGSITSSIKRQL